MLLSEGHSLLMLRELHCMALREKQPLQVLQGMMRWQKGKGIWPERHKCVTLPSTRSAIAVLQPVRGHSYILI